MFETWEIKGHEVKVHYEPPIRHLLEDYRRLAVIRAKSIGEETDPETMLAMTSEMEEHLIKMAQDMIYKIEMPAELVGDDKQPALEDAFKYLYERYYQKLMDLASSMAQGRQNRSGSMSREERELRDKVAANLMSKEKVEADLTKN